MRKTYKVSLTHAAQTDIRSIYDYISQNNPLNAVDFIDQIEHKITSLSELPERNPVIPEGEILHTNAYRHLIYKNYRIVYRIHDESVNILRVFHGSMLLDIASLD